MTSTATPFRTGGLLVTPWRAVAHRNVVASSLPPIARCYRGVPAARRLPIEGLSIADDTWCSPILRLALRMRRTTRPGPPRAEPRGQRLRRGDRTESRLRWRRRVAGRRGREDRRPFGSLAITACPLRPILPPTIGWRSADVGMGAASLACSPRTALRCSHPKPVDRARRRKPSPAITPFICRRRTAIPYSMSVTRKAAPPHSTSPPPDSGQPSGARPCEKVCISPSTTAPMAATPRRS